MEKIKGRNQATGRQPMGGYLLLALKDWKTTIEMVTAPINFAIATNKLEDRREQDDSEEENNSGKR